MSNRGKSCLSNKQCKFILANAFNTGELLPMPDFYKKYGFIPTGEGSAMYPFAKRVEAMVRETLPNIKIELVNEWEKFKSNIRDTHGKMMGRMVVLIFSLLSFLPSNRAPPFSPEI